MKVAAEVFSSTPCLLGEAPVWSAPLQGLFWLDILQCRLYFRRPAEEAERVWALPCICSAIFLLPGSQDELLLASEQGLARFGLVSGRFDIIAVSGDEAPDMRPNDAGIDPLGRIWFGTMQKCPERHAGALYSLEPGLGLRRQLAGVGIPNTLLWSPDGRSMIHADSLSKTIYRSSYEPESGTLSDSRVLVDLSAEGIDPDGSALDAEGCFWNAQWGGARVVCYDLDGREQARLDIPALQPSSCAFGGDGLATLFVTSARVGLSDDELSRYPLSGSVFRISVERKGAPLAPCAMQSEGF